MRYSKSLLIVAVVLTACGEPVAPLFTSTTQARVRFVNATSDITALTFSANGQTAAQNVAFGEPSACQAFNAGSVAFSATPVGATSAFGGTLNETLPSNGRFTVVAIGSAAVPQFLFLNDATTTVTDGRARLRIINAVPGTTASDVFVTAPGAPLGAAFATNLAFNTTTPFVELPVGQVQIRFADTGTQNVTFTGQPFALTGGQTTTIIVAPGTTLGTFRSFAVQPC